MRRTFALAFWLCLLATAGFAQSRLNGKWATDRPENWQVLSDMERRQITQVQLEVTLEDAKASGTMSFGGLGGTFYTFKDGSLTDNKIRFQTTRGLEMLTWTMELVDDNTVILSREGFNLPLVETNVLDRIAAMAAQNRPAASVPAPAPQPLANVPISGAVEDISKALIPGVTVTATNLDTNAKLTTVTDESGRYSFPTVTPGKYTMTASLPGFLTATLSDLSIGNTPLKQDFTLELRSAQALVTPSIGECGPNSSANRFDWCWVLHRAK